MEITHSDSGSCLAIEADGIQPLIVKLLQRKGMFVAEAEIVAARMLESDLVGQPEGGVATLAEFLDAMDLGDIDPRARLITVTQAPAVAVLDGSTGMGHVAATRAMEMAIEKSESTGIGSIIVRNSRPCGDLTAIARLAAQRGLVGVAIATPLDSGPADSVAWAVPTHDGIRHARQNPRGTPLEGLLNLLSAGLAGVEPSPRKHKSARFANTAEYHLLALQPDHFGCRDTLLKWHDASPLAPPVRTVRLPQEVANQLAGLARRIKFPVPWLPEDPSAPVAT